MSESSPKRIEKPIIGQSVRSAEDAAVAEQPADTAANEPEREHLSETIGRPQVLEGATYKIRPPQHISPDALYVTINDIVLNAGTDHEERRPFEVFINTKNTEHFQWITALTRLISAVFRKGGEIHFIVEELQEVFAPDGGGYFRPGGGGWTNSLVADIGATIDAHLNRIQARNAEKLIRNTESVAKKEGYAATDESVETTDKKTADGLNKDGFPPHSARCNSCRKYAVIQMDGCATCLSCSSSKCG